MQYVKIKDMEISKLILGTVQLGINYGIANKKGLPDVKSRFDILRTALSGGINTLDTAMAYGESENIIGEYLENCKNYKKPYIVTKISGLKHYMKQKEVYEYCIDSVKLSAERLKVDKIPILLLHSYDELKIGGKAALEALEFLKSEGKIGIAGISLYATDDFDTIMQYPVIEAVQVPMSIFDLQLITNGVLNDLKQKGLIVFIRSVFLQGLMFLKPEELTKNLTKAAPYIEKLNEISQREKISIAQLATVFIRDMAGVTGLVLGCETVSQIKQNIDLIESLSLPNKLTEELFEVFSDFPRDVTDPRTWGAK